MVSQRDNCIANETPTQATTSTDTGNTPAYFEDNDFENMENRQRVNYSSTPLHSTSNVPFLFCNHRLMNFVLQQCSGPPFI